MSLMNSGFGLSENRGGAAHMENGAVVFDCGSLSLGEAPS